ncbi:MAG TPA: shikimate dehydrogenase [Gallionella sp.]|jgi:shikimate dehydrogenase|nr:shikimate dehydrogenase [Gallionella sp.]
MTDKYAVIGNPVAHSKSPLIHRMFAEQTGQDISYGFIEAPLDGFATTVERLRKEGFKGCNVTVPFKLQAFNLTPFGRQQAQDANAANTLIFEGNKIIADNTDGAGLVRDIEHNLSVSLQGKRVLLLGAGGAARGVQMPLMLAGIRHLTIANRTPEKAEEMLVHGLRFMSGKLDITMGVKSYSDLGNEQFDVIINATSSGLSDEMPPLPPGVFASGALAYDMMYGRETPFMKFAREHGAQVADGLGMLVEQAAESFFIWRGVRPDTRPVLEKLRAP